MEKKNSSFHKQFLEDIVFWIKTDKKIAVKILNLIQEVAINPFEGSGKPEALKYQDITIWSRRITLEHRLVYIVTDKEIQFLQCRFHY